MGGEWAAIKQIYEQMAWLEKRVAELEKEHDPTCGGIHKPFDEIEWPEHCHVQTCPRCNRDYPL